MLRSAVIFSVFLLAIPAFCQSTAKYQVATIIDVRVHQTAEAGSSGPDSYDVSIRVGDTIYVVLYTTPLGDIAPKYAAGRQVLVSVGKNTITYNDMLGRSFQVTIESQKSGSGSESKTVTRDAK